MTESVFHLFGIRHHGPGSSRSLLRALEVLQPDCLVLEGPPEGEPMLPWIMDESLVPPVALLVYDPEDVERAAFYPFAEFSPEWNALRHALARQLPVRFMDLPLVHRFAMEREHAQAQAQAQTQPQIQPQSQALPADADPALPGPQQSPEISLDPLDWFGRAAGHADGEAWWNDLVEQREDGLEVFAAIEEAMTVLREDAPLTHRSTWQLRIEALREASMRKAMRQAAREGFERIAVICGAWHVPALRTMPAAKDDLELLKGLPKCKVESTWVPWSYRNLSFSSGYGAGVHSPGWYEFLWRQPVASRTSAWLARVARLLRDQGLDCSSAHVIEAQRLAQALAAMRERPQIGLEELNESVQTVVCMGDPTPLRLIRQALIIGDRLGQTPEQAPAVPLQRDLNRLQKSLRLKPEALERELVLDLRQPNDLARSQLLHRLDLLGVDWGRLAGSGRQGRGSFNERWQLAWRPELALKVVEASALGNTVEAAATQKVQTLAGRSTLLAELSALVSRTILADLRDALLTVTRAMEDLSADASDVLQLLGAIPALVNISRYGSVRQTDAQMVNHLLLRLAPRAAIGLVPACMGLNDEAAQAMRQQVLATDQALRLLEDQGLLMTWQEALSRLRAAQSSSGLIQGLATRLLFDAQVLAMEDTSQAMHLALSQAQDSAYAAAWLEGFINSSGMVLLHDDLLWRMVDGWLGGLGEAHFLAIVPMLRRAFSAIAASERRQLGERSRRSAAVTTEAAALVWNEARARRALPLLFELAGVPT